MRSNGVATTWPKAIFSPLEQYMSTSALYHEHGAKTLIFCSEAFVKGQTHYYAEVKPEDCKCPVCGSLNIVRRGTVERVLHSVPIGSRPVFLHIKVSRVWCKSCNIVRQVNLHIANPMKRYTKKFALLVVELSKKMSISDLANFLDVSWDLIVDILKDYLNKKYSKPDIANLKYLAIDEISISKGHRYITLVMNLITGNVIYIGDGKGSDSLNQFWDIIGPRRRKKILAVSIDMSKAYISAIKNNLPNSLIIFDHFHVVKMMNEYINKLRRFLYSKATKEEKNVLKGTMWLLLKNPENLSEERHESERLQEALTLNEPLSKAYYMKEDLRQIWLQKSKETAAKVLDIWIETGRISDVDILKKMAASLSQHREGVLNWYDHHISSGPMEGLNNKIKALVRQAYGYRNMEFFKLRILAIHESKSIETGF
jgi:transposase